MRSQLYISGEWREPLSRRCIDIVDPATEEMIRRVGAGMAEDVDAAVSAARTAFEQGAWPRCSGAERAQYLRSIAAAIGERSDELARLETCDNGKPLPEALGDIADAKACFEYYADLAEELDSVGSERLNIPDDRFSARVVREPLGVIAAIIPWNYPLLMAAWKVAPALAAGCTIVLKPSEWTPLTALALAEIADAVSLPPGVLNVVTGTGPTAGQSLAQHPSVDKVAFTGSLRTGSKIMAAAAHDIKLVSLELGGKSSLLIFEDCDIDSAVEWTLFGAFWNQGEVCSATSRVLVHEAIRSRFLERLIEESQRIRIGNGLHAGTMLGPLVSRQQLDKVLDAIRAGRAEGAKLVSGGGRPGHLDRGYFVEPTIFVDAPLDGTVWNEEIFGPVVCVRSFRSEEEAVRLANHTPYGLAAAVMSTDNARCERVAAALRAGVVWINCSQPTFVQAPWGGYKKSGIGRELGRWGLEACQQIKQITRFADAAKWGWYLR